MHIVSYDQSSLVLVVDLENGLRYEYFDIPSSLAIALQSAASVQDFFNAEIWASQFEYAPHWPNLDALLQYFAENAMRFLPPVSVHSRAADDDTPLHVACVWGDVAAVDLLLAGGADPNARGDLSCTPIYNAVSFARARCAKHLIEAGATLDDSNELSFTARDKALQSKDPRLAALVSNAA